MSKYSTERLNKILFQFSIAPNPYTFQPLNDGLINDTFLVLDKKKPVYILQRINHEVFDRPKILMANIKEALSHLCGEGYATLHLVDTVQKKEYLADDGKYWRLMQFIPDSKTYNTTTDTLISFEAGRIIGKFHSLLQNADILRFADVIPDFHNLRSRINNFQEATLKGNPLRIKNAEKVIRTALALFNELKGLQDKELPLRICHNDTKLNNILFSNTANKALCLIDLDTLMKGHFYYDFGDAIRTIVNTAPEDEKNHDKITFNKNLFEAFIDGLVASNLLLSKNEIKSLPLGATYMPFLHGLRALTDYLNNDLYYKVAYENQNLDRCLSLFAFASKALEEKEYMKAILAKKLG